MRQALFSLGVYLLALPAMAAAVVNSVEVQKGIFALPNCVQANEQEKGSCLCEANISKPVISGIDESAARKINQFFDKDFEASAWDDTFEPHCDGDAVTAKERAGNSRNLQFKVVQNDAGVLSIQREYSHYKYGMAHPFSLSSLFTFDPLTGEQVHARR